MCPFTVLVYHVRRLQAYLYLASMFASASALFSPRQNDMPVRAHGEVGSSAVSDRNECSPSRGACERVRCRPVYVCGSALSGAARLWILHACNALHGGPCKAWRASERCAAVAAWRCIGEYTCALTHAVVIVHATTCCQAHAFECGASGAGCE